MARRVLMLGWEFPPFITGGLGTACYGLTKALDRQGLEVTFVLPKTIPADGASHVRLVTPGATVERKTGRLPMPVAPTPAPAVVREPVRSAPEPVAANAPVVLAWPPAPPEPPLPPPDAAAPPAPPAPPVEEPPVFAAAPPAPPVPALPKLPAVPSTPPVPPVPLTPRTPRLA
jgi:hypothetical protein